MTTSVDFTPPPTEFTPPNHLPCPLLTFSINSSLQPFNAFQKTIETTCPPYPPSFSIPLTLPTLPYSFFNISDPFEIFRRVVCLSYKIVQEEIKFFNNLQNSISKYTLCVRYLNFPFWLQ